MIARLLALLCALCLLAACSKESTKPPDPPPVEPPEEPPIEYIPIGDLFPSWSPDGHYIFYDHLARDHKEILRYGQFSIWAYDTQTGHQGFLVGPGMFSKCNSQGTILAFSWGQTLFFYYFDTRTVRQVTHGMEVYAVEWAPDGQKLILSGGQLVDTMGNFYGRISPHDGSEGGWRGMGDPVWSADGTRLLAVSRDRFDYLSIIITDSLGAVLDTAVRAKYLDDSYSYLSWSPDESMVLAKFSYERHYHSYHDLRIFSIDGDLLHVMDGYVGRWSLDGGTIAFQRFTWMAPAPPSPNPMPDHGRSTVWLCNADGSDPHELLGWPQPNPDPDMFDGGYNWVTDTYGP